MLMFVVNSVLLGVGLAMDAFSVSMANAINDPAMKMRRRVLIASVFAFFQFLMPMIGWICVHTIVTAFKSFEVFIPWIALILLSYIGGSMLLEGLKGEEDSDASSALGMGVLLLQGVATSIDALSTGFAISDYSLMMAFLCALIIAAVTYVICRLGLFLGRQFGMRYSRYSSILGGVILIAMGLEILISHLFSK